MTSQHGEYRDRSQLHGKLVRAFDTQATAQDMQQCADAARQKYSDPDASTWRRNHAVMDAAFCQAWADKKRWKT